MRPSIFELMMCVALGVLMVGFVGPRVLQGQPEVRESQAVALQLKLQGLYTQWREAGGVHGDGEPSAPAMLTQNMLKCLTHKVNAPYASPQVGPKNFGRAGVYEKPSLYPSPAEIRLETMIGAQIRIDNIKDRNGKKRPGVILADSYAVTFDKGMWEVTPAY